MLKTINGGKMPTRGSKYSAGIDLYANEDVLIGVGETKIVPLGVCLDENRVFPVDTYLALEPRSSLRAKGIISGTGIIDIDFVPNCSLGKALNKGHCEHFKHKQRND